MDAGRVGQPGVVVRVDGELLHELSQPDVLSAVRHASDETRCLADVHERGILQLGRAIRSAVDRADSGLSRESHETWPVSVSGRRWWWVFRRATGRRRTLDDAPQLRFDSAAQALASRR